MKATGPHFLLVRVYLKESLRRNAVMKSNAFMELLLVRELKRFLLFQFIFFPCSVNRIGWKSSNGAFSISESQFVEIQTVCKSNPIFTTLQQNCLATTLKSETPGFQGPPPVRQTGLGYDAGIGLRSKWEQNCIPKFYNLLCIRIILLYRSFGDKNQTAD